MKRLVLLLLVVLFIPLGACTAENDESDTTSVSTAETSEKSIAEAAEQSTAEQVQEHSGRIKMLAGDKEFSVTLYDNETAAELEERMPLTINMSELHGNEKYYFFDEAMPTDSSVPDKINSGDIKLYSDDCLVVFYDDFITNYSYTDIGRVDNPSGLAEALGSRDITITFMGGNE